MIVRRLTISVEDELADAFDELVNQRGYLNRSEAFRDLVRRELEETRIREGNAKHCVATLSYIYNHHERQLSSRLTAMQHSHHDVTVSSMHAHLDHDECIETVILRGPTSTVMTFAQSVIAQTGVRHGRVHVIPVEDDGRKASRHSHLHTHPHT
jgi:CopG family transcriptional regulator, nickel-responsive regulator